MGFPPHTTHILQPLDVGVFNHVKKHYSSLTVTLGLKSVSATVSKSNFPKVWEKAIKQAATAKTVQSAFRRSGIFPFDPCAIDTSKVAHRQVATAPPVPSAAVSITKLGHCSTDLNETMAYELQPNMRCPTCGHEPHAVESVRLLPPELQDILEVPRPAEPKRTKRAITKTAREYTGKDIIDELRRKEESIKKEQEAKQERQRVRQLKKEEKEKARKAKEAAPKRSRRRRKASPIALSDTGESDSADIHSSENCFACALEQPPHYLVSSNQSISWVQCGQCNKWVHCVCLNVDVDNIPADFCCPYCDIEV